MSTKPLEFIPITSLINPSFWNKLSEIKLNDDKLDEKEHSVWGYFSNINNQSKSPILEVNSTSFNSHFDSQKIYIPFHGEILNVNTIEIFKDYDKTQCINRIGKNIFTSIENGKALETPSLLNRFYILSYADLKKFHFYYWFAFPVPYNLSMTYSNVKNIYEDFTKDQLEYIWDKYCDLENSQKPYFLISLENSSVNLFELKEKLRDINSDNYINFYFVFYDLSLLENSPGSTLRNYVTLILHYCPDLQGKSVNFLSLRIKRNEDYKLTLSNSLIFSFDLPVCHPSVCDFINKDPDKRWVGWEKNERGKLGPRLSNMKSFLDPKELAESSVDLNLKLMKWRLLSNIDLEKIKATKFLLLGAGTLGCSVARILLGWGARNISFVDNSIVSYSNPVRQSLFTFEDSQNSKPKSVAAAENLRKIFPGVKSKAYQLTIPMPGHPVGDSMLEDVKKDVELLTNLISEHDVIFLLMDSRESRWLPTLLGSYLSKIVINSALGFDSYLVMRHGVNVDTEEFKVRQHSSGLKSLKGNFLGCYFCNDVTAPGNSMKDRTLDQQCTVTRPGVSAIAGALAAELAISILQHKEGPKAAAFYQLGNIQNTEQELDNQCVLGIIPHSIRGYLSSFSQVLPAVERYNQCTACSSTILDVYQKDGFDFLMKVFQNSKYLEELSGLAHMNKEAEDTMIWEFSDEEEVECTDYEDENDSDAATKASGKLQLEESKLGTETPQSSGILEKKQYLQQESENNIDSISNRDKFIRKVIEDILEDLIRIVEENDKLNEMKSMTINSSSEFLNEILPEDILKIVKKLQTSSSSLSLESTKFEDAEPLKSPQVLKHFSSENCSKSFSRISKTQIIKKVRNEFVSSQSSLSSSSKISNEIVGKPGLPKELVPVLQKQESRRSSMHSNISGSTKTCQQINDIMKPKNVRFSLPNIKNKIGSQVEIQSTIPNSNCLKDKVVTSTNSRIVFKGTRYNEYLSPESLAMKEKFYTKDKDYYTQQNSNQEKSGTVSLLTLKSIVTNFASSGSSQHLSISSCNEKSKTTITGRIRRFFLSKNMRPSSESLSAEEILGHVKNKNEIITITEPQDMFSSGSLTSQNLSVDESVYYLAETDSNKTFVNK